MSQCLRFRPPGFISTVLAITSFEFTLSVTEYVSLVSTDYVRQVEDRLIKRSEKSGYTALIIVPGRNPIALRVGGEDIRGLLLLIERSAALIIYACLFRHSMLLVPAE